MDMPPLTVATPGGTYQILVGPGLLQTLPEQLSTLNVRGSLWLISDAAVYPHYGPALEAALRGAGYTMQSYTVPDGETSKDLAVAARLYDWMIGGGVERRDVVLALGGGVVGDLAGFVAATVLRGVALVQLPTTLLAMVDSAIGGKTGVNHPLGKNLIGAFHQPRLVLSDTTALASLPRRELRAGWAEVIKAGVIRDAGLFELLEQIAGTQPESGGAGPETDLPATTVEPLFPEPRLSEVIRRAAAVKVAVVGADERESGERMILNYGHTLGHALEAAAGYGTLLHGEAVAIGMDLAAQIAQRLELCDTSLVLRQRALLRAFGLPTDIPADVEPERLLALVLRDKKVSAGRVRWILPTGLGSTTITDAVPEELIRTVLRAQR